MSLELAAAIALVLAGLVPSTVVAELPAITIPADTASFTTQADLSAVRERLMNVESTRPIVLDLDGIETARTPAVYFEVYVHGKGALRGRSVGNLALYGSGVRDEATGPFQPAHVQLSITSELRGALKAGPIVALTFVAQGAGGGPPARSRSAVTIRKPALLLDGAPE